MTREEAVEEVNKAFEPAFANYIITALTEGATVSDKEPTTKNDIRDNRVKNELNRVKDELEPTTKNCESCRYYGSHHEVCNYCYKCSLWTEQEPRWIPVTERLPKENGGYLVTVKRGYVTTALWVGNAENWKEVTAWMPLPASYKEVEE